MRRSLWLGFALSLPLLAGCADQSASTEQAADNIFESPYFTVDVVGSGPDVILVPGLASSADVWNGTVEALDESFTLHVVQVSGFAGAPPEGNIGNEDVLDDLASDLAAYSATIDSPATLVGHSLGGLVTLETALNPEAKLDQIVVVDVLPFFSVLMDDAATEESMAPISAFMKATLLGQSDDVFELRQAEALAALVKSDTDLQETLEWSVRSDRAVMAQAMSEVLVKDLRDEIAAIDLPVTVIYARDEAIPNMEGVEQFYQTLYAPLSDGTLVAIDDALHFVMLDQPAAFVAALETALKD